MEKKQLTVGIFAHVDAGKTTLCEAMLYISGKIRKLGRVDRRDTYLDTHFIERERGITVFSKMAVLEYDGIKINLLDTPGHSDFVGETERTLSVIDYAILVISGVDGVQSHTLTLWELLERYNIPTIIFVTKQDYASRTVQSAMSDLQTNLSQKIIAIDDRNGMNECCALSDDDLLEKYTCCGELSAEDISECIARRELFPCIFGSGLKLDGVDRLLNFIRDYTTVKYYSDTFSARVYKINYDDNGVRLTFIKLTGGRISNRQTICYYPYEKDEPIEEKITDIRFYSGSKYTSCEAAVAGDICAVAGLSESYTGQNLGEYSPESDRVVEPVMHYTLHFPEGTDAKSLLPIMNQLESEEPLLGIEWNERYGEYTAGLMGQVQLEVVSELLKKKTGLDVTFDNCRITYKETVSDAVEGVGHFEPLRHYAEVHLLIEPAENGEGLVFDNKCPLQILDKNWQSSVMSILQYRRHKGVLTNSPLCDMKITLVSGRSHIKHTVGGDFRESTLRALRQGLMTLREKGKLVLLEPYYGYRLSLPSDCVGRASADIIAKCGNIDLQTFEGENAVITGKIPVATFNDYSKEVMAYTHGHGRISVVLCGYFPCHNAEQVIENTGYSAEADVYNTGDSVFCSHGSGTVVPWYDVPSQMHIPFAESRTDTYIAGTAHRKTTVSDDELERIMEREFGAINRRSYSEKKVIEAKSKHSFSKWQEKALYIIDGYNLIYDWDELKEVASTDLEHARDILNGILADYQAFTAREIILVYDAYNVKGANERVFDYHNIRIVFTKEGEIADAYIEKLISRIGGDKSVRVVTSDGLIQLQAVRSGVFRYSSREFREEVISVRGKIRDIIGKIQ